MRGVEVTRGPGRPSTRTRPTANAIAKALSKIGYVAEAADNELAVKIHDADGNKICTVWVPIGETTFNDLGDKYLWGKTGGEHQAPDSTGVDELVRAIARTLQ